jgi:hypothetical protein
VSNGHAYTSHDVVLDEGIYSFSAIHHNAGSHLREEILILPSHLTNTASNIDGVHSHDHMHIVPITDLTRVPQDEGENSQLVDLEISANGE